MKLAVVLECVCEGDVKRTSVLLLTSFGGLDCTMDCHPLFPRSVCPFSILYMHRKQKNTSLSLQSDFFFPLFAVAVGRVAPIFLWAQSNRKIRLTVEIRDAEDVHMQSTRKSFHLWAKSPKRPEACFAIDLELFGKILPEEVCSCVSSFSSRTHSIFIRGEPGVAQTSCEIGSRAVFCDLFKAPGRFRQEWKFLLRDGVKPVNMKIDWAHYDIMNVAPQSPPSSKPVAPTATGSSPASKKKRKLKKDGEDEDYFSELASDLGVGECV